jgi:hypothetical protein
MERRAPAVGRDHADRGPISLDLDILEQPEIGDRDSWILRIMN